MAKDNFIQSVGKDAERSMQKILGGSKRGENSKFSFQTDRYVYVRGSTFVDEVTFAHESIEALRQNKLPEQYGLLQLSLNDLQRENPEKYREWVESGLQSHPWGKGAGALVNRVLKEGEVNLQQEYFKELAKLKDNRLLLTFGPGVSITDDGEQLLAHLNANVGSLDKIMAPTFYGIDFDKKKLIKIKVKWNNDLGEFVSGARDFMQNITGSAYDVQSIPNVDKILSAKDLNLTSNKVHQAHSIGDLTFRLEDEIQDIQNIINDPAISAETKKLAQIALQEGKLALENIRAYDKLTFAPSFIKLPTAKRDKDAYKTYVKGLKNFLKQLPPAEFAIISEVSSGKFTATTGETIVEIKGDINFVTLQPANQQWAGPIVKGLTSDYRKAVEVLQKSPEFAAVAQRAQRSSSDLTRMMLLALDEMFDTKEFSKQIKKGKIKKPIAKIEGTIGPGRKRRNNKRLKAQAKKAKKKFDSLIASVKKDAKAAKNYNRPGGRNSKAYRDIVGVLNQELKMYVIDEMVYPALRNRTGRFASSVKVLGVNEQAAIMYTYRRSPYQVFSRTRGKQPWNSVRERDPGEIIDNALKKLTMARFNAVFRSEER
jgi:hypothetical protein